MTDLEKTVAYLDDMGYEKLPNCPKGGKAGLRYYYHKGLYITCDQSSFTFDKDESLSGIGYGPPTSWLDDYIESGQESKDFYDEDYDEYFSAEEEDE